MKDLKNLSLEELKKMASKNKIEGRSKMNKEELIKNLKKNNMKGGMVNYDLVKNIEVKVRDSLSNGPLVELWKYDPQSDPIMRPFGFVDGIGHLAIFNEIVPHYFHQFEHANNRKNDVIHINVITTSNNINMSLSPRGGRARIYVLAKNLYYFDIAGKDVLVIYSNEDERSNNIIREEIKNQFRVNTGNVRRVRVTKKLNELGNENFERINEYLNK